MYPRSFALVTALSLASLSSVAPLAAQVVVSPPVISSGPGRYTSDQLDNLVGPVALYPDALLAQVLVASTFPDQVADAAAFVRTNGTTGIDDQPWDVSVKAVAHYTSALNMMADKADWTATLGRAYANQSSDVMAAVQRMRSMANAQGNLQSNAQQQVVSDGGNYVIVPTQPQVIYVPVYDPYVIYTQPVFGLGIRSRYWSFGVGFPIGGWLSYDLDWRARGVYYNGWNSAYFGYGGGWRARAFPYVQINNVYVNSSYRNVYINHDVVQHSINYRNVDRYAVGVHRDTYFDSHHADYRAGGAVGAVGGVGGVPRSISPRDGRPMTPPPGSLPDMNNRAAGRNTAPEGRVSQYPNTAAPQQRRNEPGVRSNDINVVRPDHIMQSAPGNAPRVDANPGPRVIRQEAPRVQSPTAPRVEQRQAQPRVEQRQSAPRPEHRPAQESRAPSGDRGGHERRGR